VVRADGHEIWSFRQFRVCPKDRWDPLVAQKLLRIRSDHKWPEKVLFVSSPRAIAAADRSQDDLAAKHANTRLLGMAATLRRTRF
jgi:hypothetical protein